MFVRRFDMTKLSFLSVERLSDLETPVSAYLKLCRGQADSFLLESVEIKDVTGRYSVVAYDPILVVELTGDEVVTSNSSGLSHRPAADFFTVMREELGKLRGVSIPALPTVGCLVVYVGYDAVRLIERLPTDRSSEFPTARLVFPSRFVVFDQLRRSMMLLALDTSESAAAAKIAEMDRTLQRPLIIPDRKALLNLLAPDRDRYIDAVKAAQEYIRDGEIFQVVLSDSFHGETDVEPVSVYRRLRVRSPSPYMFFLDFGKFQMVGSSPETLVKVQDRTVIINPIAGTRGRSADPKRDGELEKELLGSEKERAEHVMLVDLARNDAGRVCEYGTVLVDPFMKIERYSHVMHIVSQVQGRLRPDKDAVDAFMAAFPAGTVSGAPKVRAMEIIDELESSARGPYGGAVGYFGPGNVMDTCITIRTVLFKEDRFWARVGAGIVADSIPEMEYKEIENKAAQSLLALKAAAGGES